MSSLMSIFSSQKYKHYIRIKSNFSYINEIYYLNSIQRLHHFGCNIFMKIYAYKSYNHTLNKEIIFCLYTTFIINILLVYSTIIVFICIKRQKMA